MFSTYVLIMFLVTSSGQEAGAAAIKQEFSSHINCLAAGSTMAEKYAVQHGPQELTWGCFEK